MCLAFSCHGRGKNKKSEKNSCVDVDPGTNIASVLPAAKSGKGNYIVVGSNSGANYFTITGFPNITGQTYTLANNLDQKTAYELDFKMDDGKPLTGSVGSVPTDYLFGPLHPGTPTPSACAIAPSASAPARSNFTNNSGADMSCQVRIRATF